MFKILLYTLAVVLVLGIAQGHVIQEINERILNGNVAEASEYTMRINSSNAFTSRGQQMGSGVLVTTRHLITVARLVQGYSNWTLGYGNSSVSSLRTIQSSVAILHPDYEVLSASEFFFYRNDIAIILVPQNQLDLNFIRPVALPSTVVSLPRPNEEGHVQGFGATNTSQLVSPTLREVYLTTLNSTRCQQAFTSFRAETFCAIDEYYAGNLCRGDIGSGYIVRYQGVPVLAGLNVIFSNNCSPGSVTGYVRIQNHIEWIRAVTDL